jgi:hypothetical protein
MTTSPSDTECFCDEAYEKAWRCLEELATIMLGSRALAKACVDDCFDYALKLRTGEVIRFSGARVISPGWVHLKIAEVEFQPDEQALPFRADRGVDVRIADIVWVMDAPEGS